ncbi:hypothetical protein GBF38_003342 [Nibea albiflora]|uniref:Uncharacterized protein n=1 Tax=Nibea albiflora TaxID=240163 RepID=A0ACB7FKB1_NIBAL|nr:hypothetical protein GBF38_003342 [Nibea albiflora]
MSSEVQVEEEAAVASLEGERRREKKKETKTPCGGEKSLGGRRDEREAEALIDTAPIDTPPERERDLYAAHNKWADRRRREGEKGRKEEEGEEGGEVRL